MNGINGIFFEGVRMNGMQWYKMERNRQLYLKESENDAKE